MVPPAFEIRNLVQVFDGKTVLELPDLCLARGEVLGLTGPNGSGKTTLLKILGLIQAPFSGEIKVLGQKNPMALGEIRQSISLLPQETCLLDRTVCQNLAYGMVVRGLRAHLKQKTPFALEQVGLDPEVFLNRRPSSLSGGEARRVALAARLILHPRILLLDEPVTGVDDASCHLIQKAVAKAVDQGTTLVVSGHDMLWLGGLETRRLRLSGGRPDARGPRNLISGPFLPGENGMWERALKDGQLIRSATPPPPGAVAELRPEDLRFVIDPDSAGTGRALLRARVIRTGQEPPPDPRISVLVCAGELIFTVFLREEEMDGVSLIPGRTAFLAYHPARITWRNMDPRPETAKGR